MNENNDLSAVPSAWALSVADCPDVCPDVLRKLAAHSEIDVRIAVADNNKTPIDLIEELLADSSSDLRFAIAENHNLPEKILLRLTEDENPYVAQRAQKTLSRLALLSACGQGAGFSLNFEQSRGRRVPALLMAVNAV